MPAKLVEIKETLWHMLHVPVQRAGLAWWREYLAYHAVPSNARAITVFVYYVAWHQAGA